MEGRLVPVVVDITISMEAGAAAMIVGQAELVRTKLIAIIMDGTTVVVAASGAGVEATGM